MAASGDKERKLKQAGDKPRRGEPALPPNDPDVIEAQLQRESELEKARSISEPSHTDTADREARIVDSAKLQRLYLITLRQRREEIEREQAMLEFTMSQTKAVELADSLKALVSEFIGYITNPNKKLHAHFRGAESRQQGVRELIAYIGSAARLFTRYASGQEEYNSSDAFIALEWIRSKLEGLDPGEPIQGPPKS